MLLPILDDVVPLKIQLFDSEMVVEVELCKGLSGSNVKLSNWIGAFIEASVGVHYVAFIMFWLCKFIFGAHPHYVVKPLYFYLAIQIYVGMSLPLALLFLGYLYVQLDIP